MGGTGSGRRKGDKDKSPGSPARVAAGSVNGLMAKPKITDDMREKVRTGKERMTRALLSDGLDWVEKIIKSGPAVYAGGEDGGRYLVSGSADFTWAMNYAADRGFLPRRSEAEITQPGGFAITINDARGPIGWPVAVGVGDDRHDGDGAAAVN